LNGFLSKEAMLENAAGTTPLVALLALAAALLSVAYSLRFLSGIFLGPETGTKAHDPGPGLWPAPALRVAVVIGSGLLPMAVFSPVVDAAASATTGEPIHAHLALWHGLDTPALWMSLAALGGGLALLGLYPRLRRIWDTTPLPQAKAIFETATDALALA